MQNDSNPRAQLDQAPQSARFNFEPFVGAVLVLFSSLGLMGWMFGITPLVSVVHGAVTMKVNAALALFLSGVTLLLVHRGRRQGCRMARGCALAAGIIGMLTLFEHVTGWNIGIDELLFLDTGTLIGTANPGRMSPSGAICVILSATALWHMSLPAVQVRRRLEWLGWLVMAISLLGLLGYLVGFDISPTLWRMTALAIHTALLYLLLGIAILAFAWRERQRRWLIGHRLTTMGALALTIFIMVAAFSYRSTTGLLKSADNEQLTSKMLGRIHAISTELEVLPHGVWMYLVTEDERFLDEFESSNTKIRKHLIQLRESADDMPNLRARLAAIEPLITERIEFFQESLDLRRTNGFEVARAQITSDRGKQLSDQVRTQLTEMAQKVERTLTSDHALVEKNTRRTLSVLPIGLVLSLGLFTAVLLKLNTEISTRDQITKQLKYSELLKTSILDALPAEIVLLNSVGDILDVSEPWQRFAREHAAPDASTVGVGSNYLEACKKTIITQSPYAETAINGIRKVLDGTHREFQLEYPRSSSVDTEWFMLHAIGLVHEPAGALVSHLNITATRDAERKLRESEARFRSVADNTPVLIWEAGLDKGCYYFNKCWLEFTGRTLAMESGNGWAEGVHPDDLDRCLKIYTDSFDRRENFRMEYRLRRADGQFRSLLDTGVPRYDTSGEFVGYIGSCLDITDIKEAQEEVLKVNAELEQRVISRTHELQTANTNILRLNANLKARAKAQEAANMEMESFSYSVSHDLRAPLRAVSAFSRMVLEDHAGQIDDEGQRMLGVIHGEAKRMGQLIDDLLAFSRLGRHPIELTKIDMETMAQEAFDELVAHEPERKLQINLNTLPPAFGTKPLIRQVWTNLISNAIKFTSCREIGEIEIGAKNGGDDGQIYYIKDNGIGFDSRHSDKLFGVFERLHSQKEFSGTGVGLALVKRIVERHGGRVWAEAKVDQGACFFFTLSNSEPMTEESTDGTDARNTDTSE